MRPWTERYPARYTLEMERLLELEFRIQHEAPLRAGGWVDVDGARHRVRLEYPPSFPDAAPAVWLLAPDTGEVQRFPLPHHAFPDHSLCLFREGGGPEGWRPEYTARVVVERLGELLRALSAGTLQEHGSDLDLPDVKCVPALLSPAQSALLEHPGSSWGPIQVAAPSSVPVRPVLSVGAAEGRVETQELPAAWKGGWSGSLPLVVPTPRWKGIWCAVPNKPWRELAATPGGWQGLAEQRLRGRSARHLPGSSVLLLVRRRPAGPYDRLFVQLHPPFQLTGWVRTAALPMDLFARNSSVSLDGLRAARVLCVGLGSLGAAAALLLAQAGVGRFVLFDPEALEPPNVARHLLGCSALYQPKVAGVAARILDHNPNAEVLAVPGSPFGDGDADARQALMEVLEDPRGLILSTCAVPHVEARLNALAVEHGRPLVIGTALGAAEHARVLRVLPGRTACWSCVLLQQRDWPEQFPAFDPSTPGPVQGAYHGAALPGLGVDTQEIACLVARMALSTLAAQLGGAYPEVWGDHLLWTRTGGWVFAAPGEVQRVPTVRRADCPVCGVTTGATAADAHAAAWQAELRDFLLERPP